MLAAESRSGPTGSRFVSKKTRDSQRSRRSEEVTKEISFLRILKKALATLPDLCDLCVSLSFALAGKQIASVIAG